MLNFEQACEKGFGLSCYNLAQIYETGSGVVALMKARR
jgi:carbamoyl-phosphate synthase large chain